MIFFAFFLFWLKPFCQFFNRFGLVLFYKEKSFSNFQSRLICNRKNYLPFLLAWRIFKERKSCQQIRQTFSCIPKVFALDICFGISLIGILQFGYLLFSCGFHYLHHFFALFKSIFYSLWNIRNFKILVYLLYPFRTFL